MLMSPISVLTKLDLSKQQYLQNQSMDISLLATALQHNTKLQELNLSDNSLNDSDVTNLAKVSLVHNTALKKLMLNGNCITDNGIWEPNVNMDTL